MCIVAGLSDPYFSELCDYEDEGCEAVEDKEQREIDMVLKM